MDQLCLCWGQPAQEEAVSHLLSLTRPVSAGNNVAFTARNKNHMKSKRNLSFSSFSQEGASWGLTPGVPNVWNRPAHQRKTCLAVTLPGFMEAALVIALCKSEEQATSVGPAYIMGDGKMATTVVSGFRIPSSSTAACCFMRHIKGTSSSFVQPPSGWRRSTGRR